MYARVVKSQVQLSKVDQAIDIYRDSVVPATKKQKGFKSISLLADRTSGKAISITLWETEADMAASDGHLQEQFAKLAAAFTTSPTTEHYEVIV